MTNVSRRRNARRDQIPDRVGPLLPLYLDAVRAGRRRRTRARSPWRPPRDKQYRCRRTRRERVRPAAGRRSRPPVATLPAFAWGAKFSPRCRGPQGPAPVWQRAVWATPYPTRQRSARASETQTAAAFVWFTQDVSALRECFSATSRLSSPNAASAITASTQTIHGFPCFPLAFPDGNGLAAQLHKQSPVGTTRQ